MQIPQKIKAYLTDVDIDINERLGVFFVNIGIVAAFLGVVICLLAHEPVVGTICTALIAVGAPLIAAFTRHTGHSELYGSLVAVMTIFMIPIVWLTTGAESGGTGFWLLYELFYIMLFARRKQLLPYCFAAVLVQAAAITADILHPELFFHFEDRAHALVSQIGSGVVVTIEIMVTVYVQKTLYIHERKINTKTQDTTRNFITSIANIIDTKDPYTGGHSRRVAECSAAIARRLGMSQEEADNMYDVALFHDIGKIGVPDRVLNKPGRLTEAEYALIQKHPAYGAAILEDITTIPHLRDGVLHHHEHYDGSGYPEGLAGEEIPFVARVISVADAYDAMSSSRVYRKRISRDKIIRDMKKCSGTQFDPHIADVFIKMLEEGFVLENTPEHCQGGTEHILNDTSDEMMRHITESSRQEEPKHGATVVGNAEFTVVYDYLRSLSRRFGDEMVLTDISLDAAGAVPEDKVMADCMADLNEAVRQNIRAADICTRNSDISFLLLLMNASASDVEQIIDRIRKDFYRIRGNEDIKISYTTVKIDAQDDKQD